MLDGLEGRVYTVDSQQGVAAAPPRRQVMTFSTYDIAVLIQGLHRFHPTRRVASVLLNEDISFEGVGSVILVRQHGCLAGSMDPETGDYSGEALGDDVLKAIRPAWRALYAAKEAEFKSRWGL
jgi:hypothetical protein